MPRLPPLPLPRLPPNCPPLPVCVVRFPRPLSLALCPPLCGCGVGAFPSPPLLSRCGGGSNGSAYTSLLACLSPCARVLGSLFMASLLSRSLPSRTRASRRRGWADSEAREEEAEAEEMAFLHAGPVCGGKKGGVLGRVCVCVQRCFESRVAHTRGGANHNEAGVCRPFLQPPPRFPPHGWLVLLLLHAHRCHHLCAPRCEPHSPTTHTQNEPTHAKYETSTTALIKAGNAVSRTPPDPRVPGGLLRAQHGTGVTRLRACNRAARFRRSDVRVLTLFFLFVLAAAASASRRHVDGFVYVARRT